jgi:hypothetical protein
MYNWHRPLNFQGQMCSAQHYIQFDICSVKKDNVTDIPHTEMCTVGKTLSWVTWTISVVINLTLMEDHECKVHEIMGQTSNLKDAKCMENGEKSNWKENQ